MDDELGKLKNGIVLLSDEEIIKMLSSDRDQYLKDALDCAEEEVKRRGLDINAILYAEVDPVIVKKCRLMMYGEFGHLGDIPHELTNTIANIYYEFFKIDKGLQKEGISKDYFKSENIFDDLEPFSHRIRGIQFKLDTMRNLIPYLREIDQDKQPNLYKLWLSVCYDILKYDIPNTMKKSGIRRKIERFFKKRNTHEIDGLIDRIGR